MIGKLIEIHECDAFSGDRETLLGTTWDLSDMAIWKEEDAQILPEITGYYYGKAKVLEDVDTLEFENGDFCNFLAVKFEILENTGE